MDKRAKGILRDFYAAKSRELFTYALALVRDRDAAEDIVHGVFERLLRRVFLPRELSPYVYRAIRNAAYDLLRQNHRLPGMASIYSDSTSPSVAHDVAMRDEAENLLASLSDNERECVVLKLFSGLTFQEIARTNRVSINTAASWYRRAIEKMKAQAEKEEDNEGT